MNIETNALKKLNSLDGEKIVDFVNWFTFNTPLPKTICVRDINKFLSQPAKTTPVPKIEIEKILLRVINEFARDVVDIDYFPMFTKHQNKQIIRIIEKYSPLILLELNPKLLNAKKYG